MNSQKLSLDGAYVEITAKCNLHCPYCYNDSCMGKYELNVDVIKRIVDELEKRKKYAIAISGGEPFLHPNIDEIIDYCIKKKVRPNIITNLTQLNDSKILDLLQKDIAFQITFDGHCEEIHSLTRGKNVFIKNINFIEKAIQINKLDNITIRYNVHKLNYQYFENFICLMKKYNVKEIYISFIKNIGRCKSLNYVFDNRNDALLINDIIKSFDEISKKYQDIKLNYGNPSESLGCVFYSDETINCVPRIDYKGNTYLCQLFDGDDNILGNVCKNKLEDILASKEADRALNEIHKRKNNRNEECNTCPFKSYCLGGCPALIYQSNSNLLNNDGQCYLIKYFTKNKLIEVLNGGRNKVV